MSAKEPKTYREGMEPEDAQRRGHLGEAFLTIDPRNIDAQTRLPSAMAMATHEFIGAWASGKDEFVTKEKEKFAMNTLSGAMALWEFSYEKKAISIDGKGRKEAENVMKLEAIGPQEDSGIAMSVLNEGAKQVPQGHWYSRNKAG